MMSLERLCFWRPPHVQSHRSRPHDVGLLQESMKILTHLAEEGKQAKTEATKGYKRKVNAMLHHGILGLNIPGELG